MAPSRLSTAVAAATRPSTGTCSVAMWPPMKLYLGKPFHLMAGAGVSGARSGATSKGAVMGGSSLAWPNCWANVRRDARTFHSLPDRARGRAIMIQSPLRGLQGHGAELMGVGHVPRLGPARRRRAADQRLVGQCRVDVVEGHDLLRRDAPRDVDRPELVGMIEP